MRINWKQKPCKSCSSDSLAEAMRRHTSERRRQMLASSDKCFLLSLPKLSLKDRALRRGKFNILGVVLTPLLVRQLMQASGHEPSSTFRRFFLLIRALKKRFA
jgi:hypothetical protein